MRIADLNVTIVPATPGWHLMERIHDNEGRVDGFSRNPVIAWRVEVHLRERTGELYEDVSPVVVDAWDDSDILERPDGIIVFMGDRECSTEAEALAYANHEKAAA